MYSLNNCRFDAANSLLSLAEICSKNFISYKIETLFTLTKVKSFSGSVITAILDHPNCFMACIIPKTCVSSLDTVLRKSGNISVSERRGDPDVGEIWNNTNNKCYGINLGGQEIH